MPPGAREYSAKCSWFPRRSRLRGGQIGRTSYARRANSEEPGSGEVCFRVPLLDPSPQRLTHFARHQLAKGSLYQLPGSRRPGASFGSVRRRAFCGTAGMFPTQAGACFPSHHRRGGAYSLKTAPVKGIMLTNRSVGMSAELSVLMLHLRPR